jgi:signal transduction histidine kinase
MQSARASRAASAGLAAVVLSLAAFSIFAAYTTQTQVDRAARSDSLARSYEAAIAAFRAEERLKLGFFLDPSQENALGLEEAGNLLAEAVNEITVQGGQEDAELASDLLALHDRYLVTTERLLGAMAAGNRIEAQRIDDVDAQPLFLAMQVRLTAAAEERVAESNAALAALGNTARWLLILAPVVFAIGFVLLLGLWRILSQNDRVRQQTYREIEQLSKLRAEFVSTVSHEFRTPLTGIQGFSEMMRDEVLPVDLMREYAGDINKDAKRLNRLINDMLDLDQLEAGQMKLRVGPVDLNGILRETAAGLTSNGVQHRIELDLEEGLPAFSGDADRLTQVVTNLLGNAIKYSPRGGPIELRTKRDEDSVMLTVRDRGIGIPPEHLEKIFTRYSRIEAADTQSIQGTGLGLPIVRHIVQLYQGRVWATSESGQGSVFHVQLPLDT